MCLYPELIRNPKYKPNKKNGGNPPPLLDQRVAYIPIGCGQCMECIKQKANQWKVRLYEEINSNPGATFVTLTYSEEKLLEHQLKIEERKPGIEGYALENAIATYGARLANENHRKATGKAMRHWLVTELGHENTERIHMHGLVWNKVPIEDIWLYGFVYKGTYVSQRTINYIMKYITKTDIDHKHYKPVILTSAGIGANYSNSIYAKNNKYKGAETIETYRNNNGTKVALPIYYRNKLFTEQEKEQLWINRIEKQERWVNGQKIDTSTKEGMEKYLKILAYNQKRNEKLGYGTSEKNWQEAEYENQMRALKQAERKLKQMPPAAPAEGG